VIGRIGGSHIHSDVPGAVRLRPLSERWGSVLVGDQWSYDVVQNMLKNKALVHRYFKNGRQGTVLGLLA
jgi:hypothetical protein